MNYDETEKVTQMSALNTSSTLPDLSNSQSLEIFWIPPQEVKISVIN